MEFTTEFSKRTLSGYAGFLAQLGIMTDKDGLTYVKEGDAWLPMTMRKRRLVLPTQDILRDPNWEAVIPFHPFSEHLNKGKSPVLESTNRIVNLRLNQTLCELLMTMVTFAVNTDAHADASAELKSYLRLIPDVNKKTVADFKKFLGEHVDGGPEKSLITIYLKRGGELAGKTFSRMAVVSSPARKAFGTVEPIIFDYKFSSKRNRDYLLILLDYLLPKLATDIGYSVGTTAPVAPWFISMATAYVDIMTDLNRQLAVFSDVNADLGNLAADMTWTDILDNAADVSSEIRALPENTGADEDGDVRVQADITERERQREERREQRQVTKSSRNQYAERGREDDRRDADIDDAPRKAVPRWKQIADRDDDRYDRYDDRRRDSRRDDRDDRYDDRRDSRDWRDRHDDRRGDDRYRDRDDRYRDDRRGRDDDRYERRSDRGRDRYDDRDYDRDRYRDRDDRDRNGPTTASGIPLDPGTPIRRDRYRR